MNKISVGVLGATGIVGQQYLQLLSDHPWFEVNFIASSDRSAGKTYKEAVSGRWRASVPVLERFGKIRLHRTEDLENAEKSCRLIFSALSSDAAKIFEEQYAKKGMAVITNASYHRLSPDVPVLIPEVNPEHASLIPMQQKKRGWKDGFIVAKPNCSLQSYMIPLAPLHSRFKVKQLLVATMQAVTGAGYPGVSSIDIADNIIPYIVDEEEKSEKEPLKIWGAIKNGSIVPADDLLISAHCNRVPVLDGHMACVSVQFEKKPKIDEILSLWRDFQGVPQTSCLPSAPSFPIAYLEDCDRPQPRRDRDCEKGMGVSVGRLRDCSVLDYRFVALSHNIIRGAAGGGVLNAELLVNLGYLK